MFSSMNISQFYTEDDYLLKFLEIKGTKKSMKKSVLTEKFEAAFAQAVANSTNSSLPAFNLTLVANNLFSLLDIDNDGYVKFGDFAHFMQLLYIFNNQDSYGKGKLTVASVIETFKSYSEYPRISYENRHRVKRLDMINQDLYINALELIVIFKIDDIVQYYVRETDKTTIYEVDLKSILAKCGLRYMPDSYLNKCLRGNDANNIPKYDWECCITTGITVMSQYYEAAKSYLLAKKNNLNLTNTIFFNIDPQLA